MDVQEAMKAADVIRVDAPQPQTQITNEDHSGQRQIFHPPLSYQRKKYVCDFLENNTSIASVTDFGCGNGRILNFLKTIPHLEAINFVDSDRAMLDFELDYNFTPGLCEIMFGRSNSNKDLMIRVFHGDVTVPCDKFHADCITMVEVIEHMDLPAVERATRAIFSYYQPKYAVITTPNSEFNHLLRQPGESDRKFRHFDHKFEWTRAEFAAWANKVCQQFPGYSCQFDGVGHLPGSEPYGPCTQIAIFTRNTKDKQLPRAETECFDLMFDALNVKDGYFVEDKKKVSLLMETLFAGAKHEIKPQVIEHVDWS